MKCLYCDSNKVVEVKKARMPDGSLHSLYPRDDPHNGKIFKEFRYACGRCGKEWTCDTSSDLAFEVPPDSQFSYSWTEKCLILRK